MRRIENGEIIAVGFILNVRRVKEKPVIKGVL
jgi:hypothetical protein